MSDDPPLRERFAEGLWVGDWFVEPMLNRIRLEDEEIQLEPKVMEVLLCLAKRPGKTVTKDQFKDEVWRETVVTDDVLSRCISQLRKVFDDDPKDPSYIETIRKTGYRLVAPVQRPDPTGSAPTGAEERTSTASTESTDSPIRRLLRTLTESVQVSPSSVEDPWSVVAARVIQRKWRVIIAGLIGAFLVFGGAFWLFSNLSASGDAPLSALPFTSFSGEEFDPALSPVGHQVAFAWRQPDSLDQNIYLMQRGAEQPLQLSPDSTLDWSPTWSPDGRFIAYAQEDDGVHRVSIVPSIGGQAQPVFTLPHRHIQSVAWRPDTSRRALVVSSERRPHQAFALSIHFPDTDSMAPLTSPPLWSTGDVDPTPSPDGSQIAFVRGTVRDVEDIFVIPASGGTPTRVTTDSTAIDGIAWSADGTDILYAAERGGISGLWRVEADGGDPTLIRSASAGTRFSHPTLSPRSNRLAYTQKSAQLDVWKLSRPDQYAELRAEPLLSSTQTDANPSIAPSGKRIAFVSERSGTPEIWIAQADGSAPNRLTSLGGPAAHSVRWSPEGKRLCFVTRKRGQSDLYLMSASGGAASRLTKSRSEDLVPRWSQDGRRIYFASNRTGQWEAWRIRVSTDSQRVQQVTTGGAVAVQESATDSTLYLVRPDTTGIWATPLDTTNFPVQVGLRPRNASGDSSAVASGEQARPASGGTESASPLRQVIEDFNPRERSSWWVGENGIHFVYRESNRAVLAYFDFTSPRILPLYEFPDWRPVQSLAVGPGGEWFAYTHVLRRESDIMLVENFR